MSDPNWRDFFREIKKGEGNTALNSPQAMLLERRAARIAELEAELNAWRSELFAATGGHATTPKLAAEIVRQLRDDFDAAKAENASLWELLREISVSPELRLAHTLSRAALAAKEAK